MIKLSKDEIEEESEEIEAVAAAISAALMSQYGPAFSGAVLTLCLGHVLALLDDDKALKTATMHFSRAMEFRKHVRGRMDRLKRKLEEEIAKEEAKHAQHH